MKMLVEIEVKTVEKARHLCHQDCVGRNGDACRLFGANLEAGGHDGSMAVENQGFIRKSDCRDAENTEKPAVPGIAYVAFEAEVFDDEAKDALALGHRIGHLGQPLAHGLEIAIPSRGGHRPDLILATDMLDLTTFLALTRPGTGSIRIWRFKL